LMILAPSEWEEKQEGFIEINRITASKNH